MKGSWVFGAQNQKNGALTPIKYYEMAKQVGPKNETMLKDGDLH